MINLFCFIFGHNWRVKYYEILNNNSNGDTFHPKLKYKYKCDKCEKTKTEEFISINGREYKL